MLTTRAVVLAAFDEVAAWARSEPRPCLVTDAGDGWTVCDLDLRDAPRLAAHLDRDVWVLAGEEGDEVQRIDPVGVVTELPSWVDDPEDAEEVAAFDAAWEGLPDLLRGTDARLTPPRAHQTLLVPTPEEEFLQAVLTGLAVPLTLVQAEGWTVVAADEDLVPIGAGLTSGRSGWGLVLATDGTLASLTLLRRGVVEEEHVWNRRTLLTGAEDEVDADGQPLFDGPALGPGRVDAARLLDLVGTPHARDEESFVRAVLRREGPPVDLLDDLVLRLGLGEAGRAMTTVLRGEPLADHPAARHLEPPDSFWAFLRASASGAFLDPEEVPWFSVACALLLPLLVANLCFRAYQLATGTLDGWGTAQLVGAALNIPFAALYLRRVLLWRSRR